MDRILLAQNPSNAPPSYVPDGQPNYPTFDVSLQAPLPPSDTFISSTFSFISPPLFALLSAFVTILIVKAIISSFKK